MKRVAALCDIHANLPALDAVLADVGGDRGMELVVIGGDVVSGPFPRETLERLHEFDVRTLFLMGNADRDLFNRSDGSSKPGNDWCADRLDEDHLAFLRAMPPTISVEVEGLGPVLFCHGSPRSDLDPITLGTPDATIESWCTGVAEQVVVCGHTHGQFERHIGGLRLVNAGSVGNPFGAPGAYWAMFGPDVELRCTPYDVEAAAKAIRSTSFPFAERMANEITSYSTPEDAAEFFHARPTASA